MDTSVQIAEQIESLQNEDKRIKRSLEDIVMKARKEGMSWAWIGEALGISPQAAQQRFLGIIWEDPPKRPTEVMREFFQQQPDGVAPLHDLFAAVEAEIGAERLDQTPCKHGGGPEWQHRVRGCISTMKDKGEIESVSVGVYRLRDPE